jgi:hypothetical protein
MCLNNLAGMMNDEARLISNGESLIGGRTLAEFGLEEDDTVELVSIMTGC